MTVAERLAASLAPVTDMARHLHAQTWQVREGRQALADALVARVREHNHLIDTLWSEFFLTGGDSLVGTAGAAKLAIDSQELLPTPAAEDPAVWLAAHTQPIDAEAAAALRRGGLVFDFAGDRLFSSYAPRCAVRDGVAPPHAALAAVCGLRTQGYRRDSVNLYTADLPLRESQVAVAVVMPFQSIDFFAWLHAATAFDWRADRPGRVDPLAAFLAAHDPDTHAFLLDLFDHRAAYEANPLVGPERVRAEIDAVATRLSQLVSTHETPLVVVAAGTRLFLHV